jgi:ATP-dependent DNA helicase RecG
LDALQLFKHLNETDEHARIEAKSIQCGLGRSILETVCSFSNEPGLGGGNILLGVAAAKNALFPTYKVLGISDSERVQSKLAMQCASGVFNQTVRLKISIETIQKRQVVVAFVPEVSPNEKPVIQEKWSTSGAYLRIGPTDQRCTEDDLGDDCGTGSDRFSIHLSSLSNHHSSLIAFHVPSIRTPPNQPPHRLPSAGV